MRVIKRIFIHCSATKPSMDIGAKEIKQWHVKDNGWKNIGYHDIIRRDGTVEEGRPYEEVGAHCAGQNHDSIGIVLVGGIDDKGKPEANFTQAQWKTLTRMLRIYKAKWPSIQSIHGHNEFAAKACPSFDVQKWLKENPV